MNAMVLKADRCFLCDSSSLETVVKLNPIPIATPVLTVPQALIGDAHLYDGVPMHLNLCLKCGQLQVAYTPNRDFEYRNFAYRTGESPALCAHFERYARDVCERYSIAHNSFIVEIGSNDGTLSRCFQKLGHRVLGIDPALGIAAAATASGVETIGEFFTADLARKIRLEYGAADVVCANFVTANIVDMAAFADAVRALMASHAIFVFETQYGADVIEGVLLDTVYHEHVSYFMLKPLVEHYRRHEIEVISVERVATKGGSIRVVAKASGNGRQIERSVPEMLASEKRKGADTAGFFGGFGSQVAETRLKLRALIDQERSCGRSVAGWGVSLGTSALLAQFDIGAEIDYLFDDNPTKEPLLRGPGYRIPIVPTSQLLDRKPSLIVVFAWRYIDPIMSKHAAYLEQGGRFVVPLPRLSIVEGRGAMAPNTVAI
jgi:hypothetical protein